MDEIARTNLDNLQAEGKEARYDAFMALLSATEEPVDWAYEVWDEMLANLSHKDNHQRAIAAQLLCNLAKSDPQNRMLADFDRLFAVTKDKRFVTARHSLQAIWKVGIAGERQKSLVVESLERRYIECALEKNSTLIRYDILQGLRNLYVETGDEKLREQALRLIEMEADPKYRKKYARLW